jgi:Fe-S-cluster-containing dehydrogenase component
MFNIPLSEGEKVYKNSETPPCVTTCPTQALIFGVRNTEVKKAAEQAILKES